MRRPSRRGRGHLWATQSTKLLHATERCCNGMGNRVRVRDHHDPSYFDSDDFELCRVAARGIFEDGTEFADRVLGLDKRRGRG
jgi:hypothetical protein